MIDFKKLHIALLELYYSLKDNDLERYEAAYFTLMTIALKNSGTSALYMRRIMQFVVEWEPPVSREGFYDMKSFFKRFNSLPIAFYIKAYMDELISMIHSFAATAEHEYLEVSEALQNYTELLENDLRILYSRKHVPYAEIRFFSGWREAGVLQNAFVDEWIKDNARRKKTKLEGECV